jgi:hypothetical protein
MNNVSSKILEVLSKQRALKKKIKSALFIEDKQNNLEQIRFIL